MTCVFIEFFFFGRYPYTLANQVLHLNVAPFSWAYFTIFFLILGRHYLCVPRFPALGSESLINTHNFAYSLPFSFSWSGNVSVNSFIKFISNQLPLWDQHSKNSICLHVPVYASNWNHMLDKPRNIIWVWIWQEHFNYWFFFKRRVC